MKIPSEDYDMEEDPDEHLDEWISRMYENPRVWMNQDQKRQDDIRQLKDDTWTRMSGR